MSLISDAWAWYVANRENVAPLLGPLGSVVVGLGTVSVGGLVARAALRQAGIASRQAEIARLRHEEQTQADRARRVTDTFSKAVEQLGSEKIEVRLGGVYTLERLAHEAFTSPYAPDLYWTVMETLTGFVRERARWKEPQENESERSPPATDIAAVLSVIQRRPEAGRKQERQRRWYLDLKRTDLRRANLNEVHLEYALLADAHLEGAYLGEAHLEGASLVGVHFNDAFLGEAHLEGAILRGAHLKGAILWGAHLDGADLGTRLEGVNLMGAHLDGTNFKWTYGDAETVLPDGIERPAHWPPVSKP